MSNAKIDWSEYMLRLRDHGEEYQYGYGSDWDYEKRFPVEEGYVLEWSNYRISVDRLDDEKGEIDYTYSLASNPRACRSGTLHTYFPQAALESSSQSGGANDFFWKRSKHLDLELIKKEDTNE